MYLPASRTGGSPYCLDPQSDALRASLANVQLGDQAALSREALAEDLGFLAGLLAKVYAGYPELSQRYDLQLGEFFAAWAASVRAEPGTISFAEGVVDGFVRLARFHRDRHLAPIGGDVPLHDRPALQVAEFVGPAPAGDVDLTACALVTGARADTRGLSLLPGTLRRAQRVGADGRVVPVIAASTLGPSPAAIRLRCPSSELALARRSRAVPSDLGGPAYTSAIVGDTAILRVRRFAGDDADLAKLEELPADYAKHRRARRIVFDVRSNGGGDDSTLFKWIFQAAAGPWNQGVTVDFSAGVGPCRDWNALVVGQLVSGEIDGVDAIAERDAALATLTATASDEVLEVDAGLREGRAERPFAGPIFVLVDRGTASSGESVPQYLRLALGARVIGERSAGFVDFGNVVPFVLPRTGLWVQVPTTRFFSGRSAEMVGLEVDTYLDAELMGQPAEALLPVIDAIEAAGAGPRR